MKRSLELLAAVMLAGAGCGRRQPDATEVVRNLMLAYETRNDSLYASLFAEDFRYYFEPAGADSSDILRWGREEEIMAAGHLFRTPEVDRLVYRLDFGDPRPVAGREGWMTIPVSGGALTIMVKSKDPVYQELNRQEILVRPRSGEGAKGKTAWEIVEWHDYPAPLPPGEAGASGAGSQ